MPHPFKGTTKLPSHGPKPPKIGEIPGFPVGSRWPGRRELADDGLHAYLVNGIWGTQRDGAYSIILSGGYEDDVDGGHEFTYTGQGGQTKREEGEIWHNKQIKDQEWKGGNLVLRNSLREDSHPIRVIRGHLLNSAWAPEEGYQYDGLYKVVKAEFKSGNSGFLICSFKFERLPGQIELPGKNPIRPMRPKRSGLLVQIKVPAPSSVPEVHRVESDLQEHNVRLEHTLSNPRKTRRSLSLEISDQEAEPLTKRPLAKKPRIMEELIFPSPHDSPMASEILSRSASCSTEENPLKGLEHPLKGKGLEHPISGTTLTNVNTLPSGAEQDHGVSWQAERAQMLYEAELTQDYVEWSI